MEVISLQTFFMVAAAFVLLFVPGIAIYRAAERVLASSKSNGGPMALLFGIGLSVGFWPLLLLYFSLLGLRFTSQLIEAVLAISLLLALLAWWLRLPRLQLTRDAVVSGLALAVLTLLALALRLGDIQGLAVPMFGDSLHHTMITTIIAQTGQVPTGYEPFVPVTTFTYHFGFHTLAAVLAQLTGATPKDAVLVMGQVLIVLSLPVAYLFSQVLFRSRLAGLVSALITGFISVMPSYYVNWGRYTQLAGQILLPVAMAVLVRLIRGESKRLDFALTASCVAGLAVVHYRILIFYGLFAVALAIWWVVANWGQWSRLIRDLAHAAGAVAVGVLLAAPWLLNVLANYFPGLIRRLGAVTSEYLAGYNSGENFIRFVGLALAALGVLGVIAALWSLVADRAASTPGKANGNGKAASLSPPVAALSVATWVGLLIASLWPVPGAIGSYTVAISLYIPLVALGGYGAAWLAGLIQPRLHLADQWWSIAVVAAAPVCALLFGIWHLSHPESFAYVHEADLRAFKWIDNNTANDARFLISSEFTYAGRAVTASDAGMWIPLLAGRNVSVPALAAWTEQPIKADFFTDTKTLAALTQPPNDPETQRLVGQGITPQPQPPGSQQTLALMQKLGITHVYSGSPGGASKQRLNLAGMRKDNCHFKLLYGPDEGVYIFSVVFAGSDCTK